MAQRVELAIEQDTVHSTLLTSAVYYALLFYKIFVLLDNTGLE